MIRLALVQFSPAFGNKAGNIERLLGMIAGQDADVFVLPELCTTGYFFQSREELAVMAEDVSGRSAELFRSVAVQKRAWLIAGMAERHSDLFFNSVFVFSPDGSKPLVYRKSHLFYKESFVFEPGMTGFPVIHDRRKDVAIGIMLCYDWRFPEAARVLALDGADIIACPSNLVTDAWMKVMPARAIENKVFVAVANRAGSETRGGETLSFRGLSALYDPYGEFVVHADGQHDAVLTADIDQTAGRDKRFNSFNDIFRDRRPELYGRICRV
jgi:predicted amidohydrolase